MFIYKTNYNIYVNPSIKIKKNISEKKIYISAITVNYSKLLLKADKTDISIISKTAEYLKNTNSKHNLVDDYRMCHAQPLQSCLTLCNAMESSPPGSSVHGDSPGKNTGVGCHVFLQGIFPTQESNPCLLSLLHCRRILYC